MRSGNCDDYGLLGSFLGGEYFALSGAEARGDPSSSLYLLDVTLYSIITIITMS